MTEASQVPQGFSMENNGSKLGDQRRPCVNGSQRGGAEHFKGGNSKNKGRELGKGQHMFHLFIQRIQTSFLGEDLILLLTQSDSTRASWAATSY